MKTLQELKNELKETRKQISAYKSMVEFNDEDKAELSELKKKASDLDLAITIREESEKADVEEQRDRDAETKRQVEEGVKAALARQRRIPGAGDGTPYQTQFSDTKKYDHLDTVALSLLIDLQKGFASKNVKYVDGSVITPTAAALKMMALRVPEFDPKPYDSEKAGEARLSAEYVQNALKAALGLAPDEKLTKDMVSDGIKGDNAAYKAATDPMYTGGAGIGSDWVGTAYSTELWRKVRAENRVVSKIPSEVIPDGYSNKTWPLEGADMTWYKVSEATASDATLKVPAATVTASQIGTANKNIPLTKLGARGLYTQELDEDSLIRFAAQLRTQLETSGSEMLESAVIDGDVETSANKNINHIAGTPVSTDYYLVWDGFRKLPLITTTANSLSAAGSLAIDDFLSILQLMGTAGIAGADPSKVNFIMDGNTYYALAKLPEVKTRDVNSAATVENGLVTKIWNVGVIPSWQMHKLSADLKTNTAGKVDQTTTTNNTRGATVAVRWDQWKLAYKRRMTLEVTRIANADSWEIVALTRLGFGYRDGEASAILYNIGL